MYHSTKHNDKKVIVAQNIIPYLSMLLCLPSLLTVLLFLLKLHLCTFKTYFSKSYCVSVCFCLSIFHTLSTLRLSHTHTHSFPSARLELCVWLNLAGLICSLQTCRTDKSGRGGEEERRQKEERRQRENEEKQHWKERTGV